LAMAAAFLTYPMAVTIKGSSFIPIPVMWKFLSARRVCIP
jgi:hypothetical protein